MCGAIFKITHQNPDNLKEAEKAFELKGVEDGYKEVCFGRETNSGRLYIAIKGNSSAQIARLDPIAAKTLKAFLEAEKF